MSELLIIDCIDEVIRAPEQQKGYQNYIPNVTYREPKQTKHGPRFISMTPFSILTTFVSLHELRVIFTITIDQLYEIFRYYGHLGKSDTKYFYIDPSTPFHQCRLNQHQMGSFRITPAIGAIKVDALPDTPSNIRIEQSFVQCFGDATRAQHYNREKHPNSPCIKLSQLSVDYLKRLFANKFMPVTPPPVRRNASAPQFRNPPPVARASSGSFASVVATPPRPSSKNMGARTPLLHQQETSFGSQPRTLFSGPTPDNPSVHQRHLEEPEDAGCCCTIM